MSITDEALSANATIANDYDPGHARSALLSGAAGCG
jgi:hypothetical protein